MTKRYVFGFTLIELLVVIAIIAMLAAILIPAVNSALFNAALTTTVMNGKGIYTGAFGEQLDKVVLGGGGVSLFPSNETSSTAYFIRLVDQGLLDVTYDYFSARGLEKYKSIVSADFKSDGNAWNLVNFATGDAKDGTPWLYTKNGPTTIPVDKNPLTLQDIQPFGTKAMVVVQKGGSSFALKKTQLTGDFMNPTQVSSNLAVVGP